MSSARGVAEEGEGVMTAMTIAVLVLLGVIVVQLFWVLFYLSGIKFSVEHDLSSIQMHTFNMDLRARK